LGSHGWGRTASADWPGKGVSRRVL
jgi:hypothetical protein